VINKKTEINRGAPKG